MATSLAEQLRKLTVPQTSALVHSKKRASLLFDPKDAADINREAIYKIGLSGLKELIAVDSRFVEFEKSLFDETSIHLQRAVEDPKANAKLDYIINRYLLLLSPYLALNASHKSLEWLICRFHIHEYNTDGVLALFLPYHNTNIFARMVQLLPVQNKSGKWLWLQPLKKEGIPMSKLFLLSRASSDTSFFKFVCNLPLQGVQVHGERSVCLTVLFAFYCTTVIGALDQVPQVTEVHLTHLLPSLMGGLSTTHTDFTASAFMILGHLVTKIRLTPPIFTELFYKVCKAERLHREAVLVLVVMVQSGRPPPLLAAVLHLATTSWFLSTLSQLATEGIVVLPLVSAILTDTLSSQQAPLQEFTKRILEKLAFNNDEAKQLLKLLVELPLLKDTWYHGVLHQMEKSYPVAFDEIVKSHPKLLGLIPGYTERNELFTRLNHPEPDVRLQAIKYIKSETKLLKEAWVKEAVIELLKDEDLTVAAAALKLGMQLPVDDVLALAARCWHCHKGKGITLASSVLRHLPSDLTLLLVTLPFLLPTNRASLRCAKAILGCKCVQDYALLKPLCNALEEIGQDQDIGPSNHDEEDNISQTLERFSKAVWKYIQKDLRGLSVPSVVEAEEKLKSHGQVYQLMALLIKAGSLPNQPTTDSTHLLFRSIKDYNSSQVISADVESQQELKANNLSLIVSVCRKGKLPFQGSLYVLTLILKKMKFPILKGTDIHNVKEPGLDFLVDTFRLALEMKNSTNVHVTKLYSAFCDGLFEKCCESTEEQMNLLCSISLGCPEIAGECLSRVVDLNCASEDSLVPAVLVALGAEDRQVRHTAVSLLTQHLALPTYSLLFIHLAEYSEEMTLDMEQVNVALYMCLSPDPSVQSLHSQPLRRDFACVLTALLNIVVEPQTPDYIRKALLNILDQINSENVLGKLLPLGLLIAHSEHIYPDRLEVLCLIIKRVNVSTVKLFEDNFVWMLVEACLFHKTQLTLPSLILQQVDRELFAALSNEHQKRLLGLIVKCCTHTEHGDVTSACSTCVKRLALDGGIVVDLIHPMRDFTIDVRPQSDKKRAWVGKKAPSLLLLTSAPWKEGLCLLEFIQNKKKLDNVHVIIPTLFEILNRCLQFEEQSPVEYTKQVLLTCLLHCCTKLTTDLPEASVQVELVVECVRASPNPQTHHHALLLLAHIATMIPNRVLLSIMPIFTFMGSSLLRQDDIYSFQIISKIIDSIIPVLSKSGSQSGGMTGEIVGVLQVFARALLDVPEHRRIPLFTKLLETLDHGQLLWAFVALVCETHTAQSPPPVAAKEQGSIPQTLDVGLQLCHQFPPSTLLTACYCLIDYLCSLPIDKSDKAFDNFKVKIESSLFNIKQASDKQFRHYRYTVLTFLSLLLSSKHFLNNMAKLTAEEMQDLKVLFQRMFESILTYTQFISKQVDSNGGRPTARYWHQMYNVCFDVMAKTNALLPGDMFLDVVDSLLHHQLPTVCCKALELLNWRIQQDQPLASSSLLGLLPQLLTLVEGTSTVTPLTQQMALLSIKFLARKLAGDNPTEFQQVFVAVTKIVGERSLQDPVLASAVLCLGELCYTLGPHAIVSLPMFMPALLHILLKSKPSGSSSGDLLLISTVSAVYKVVDSLASFMSPYIAQLLQHLCMLVANCNEHSESARLQPVLQKMKATRQKLSTVVPLRTLLPGVSECYTQLITTPALHPPAVATLLSILADSFQSGVTLTPELSSFFLSALDFRSQHPTDGAVEVLEPAVISAIVALVLKLSESSFRPFYYKIFNWAIRCEDNKGRLITFYKLTHSIAESLKGLFVTFADYFLKNAALLLDETNVSKQKSVPDCSKELLEAVLRALLTVFLHDASHFVTKERFDTLMQPLVDQLENNLGGEELTVQRTRDIVIPCLTHMAVSVADDTLWKQLNYQILLKTRHSQAQVRIGGALAVCEIAKKLREEFLPLLPETVPFLAELLEDEIETVEKTSERVVQELEAALGEPISKYF